MNITITNININAITNIGSLNIGKTIICKNKASITSYQDQEKTDSPDGIVPDVSPGVPGGETIPPPGLPHIGPDVDISRTD